MRSEVLNTRAADDANMGHLSEGLVVIQVVAHYEGIGDRESYVVCLEAAALMGALLQQGRHTDRARLELLHSRDELGHGRASVNDVLHEDDVTASQGLHVNAADLDCSRVKVVSVGSLTLMLSRVLSEDNRGVMHSMQCRIHRRNSPVPVLSVPS